MKIASLSDKKIKSFRQKLMGWHHTKNNRTMPWKGIKDVYKIWLSEIILQQTRVEQGTAYYERMLQAFPGVFELAKAPEKEVMKLWEGLGYYSRCRNLHATARFIVEKRSGVFPDTYEDLLSLKGVGPYTAAAIASFAYNIPKPVVDGNVIRVLSRIFGITEPSDHPVGRKKTEAIAEACIDKKDPAGFNQAIMDFGATVCKPANPHCGSCSLKKNCFAYANDAIGQLPVVKKKIKKKNRWVVFIILRHKKKIAIHQRKQGDIWAGLFEFPWIEFPGKSEWISARQSFISNGIPILNNNNQFPLLWSNTSYSQQLTHQKIHARVISVKVKSMSDLIQPAQWIDIHQLPKFAFPKLINDIMKNELAEAQN